MLKVPNVYTEAEIATSLSTQIIIKSQTPSGDYIPVGAVRRFHVVQNKDFHTELTNENRVLKPILIPGQTTTTIELERTVFDGLSIAEAFGQGFRSITHQQKPFNIQVVSVLGADTVVTTYNNCWFSCISTPIKADDYFILESATILCEYISAQRK